MLIKDYINKAMRTNSREYLKTFTTTKNWTLIERLKQIWIDGSVSDLIKRNVYYNAPTKSTITPEWLSNNKAEKLPLTTFDLDNIHAILGISSEVAEITDNVASNLALGKGPDLCNLQEEIGDILWYVALLVRANGLDIDKILASNIEKLAVRYPNGFDEKLAVNRNIASETKLFS